MERLRKKKVVHYIGRCCVVKVSRFIAGEDKFAVSSAVVSVGTSGVFSSLIPNED
jgi:hypothetical protein